MPESENANVPKKPKLSKGKRPSPKPRRLLRNLPMAQGTLFDRLFAWLRTPEHKWEFGIKVVTLVVAVAGTWLLLSQNGLLKSQNNLLENQNGFIKQQMSLEEASRRSALIMLMSNIMDKVDREIEEQKRKNPRDSVFALSQSLIGQIAALTHSFKPYRYLDGDMLIAKPLSPERAQLLITLTQLPLNYRTFAQIYRSSTFSEADLQRAILDGAILMNIDLRGADLRMADLSHTYLRRAKLKGANLEAASLWGANLREVDLREANLRKSTLAFGNLREADFKHANLREADLVKARLWWADLRGADLRSANLRSANLYGAYLGGQEDIFEEDSLEEEFRKELDLFEKDLIEQDLIEAGLFKSNVINLSPELNEDDLQDANLRGAILDRTNFIRAILWGVNFDTIQASQVKSFYKCQGIQTSLENVLLKTHPQLFEKPEPWQ